MATGKRGCSCSHQLELLPLHVQPDLLLRWQLPALLLSHFSRVRLCVTPWTAAHQAPPSLGFSRQEPWSGLPFPSPMHASESEVAQSCPTLSDPMDCSLLGPSIHGIFQARVLEWGAIAFSRLPAHPEERCDYIHIKSSSPTKGTGHTQSTQRCSRTRTPF